MIVAKRIFHFFGGIYFALILISLAAILAVAGSFLESFAESHLLADRLIYGHPFFSLLLCGFFVNILFAALHRWPFERRHTPFLMAHLGLLMIIGGTILKNSFGIQGSMVLFEGNESQKVLIPNSYSLFIENQNSNVSAAYSFKEDFSGSLISLVRERDDPFKELDIKIVAFYPHSEMIAKAWEKNSQDFVNEKPPFFLSFEYQPARPHLKLEDNAPLIVIQVTKNKQIERIALVYDSFKTNLKQSIMHGEYFVSFRPIIVEIPYRLKLRQARQISYPYGFECDLLIKDNEEKITLEKTLSMNHIHETKEGHRFYLSDIFTSSKGIQGVQLIVNHDPFKYFITYPGIFLIFVGIICLFFAKDIFNSKS